MTQTYTYSLASLPHVLLQWGAQLGKTGGAAAVAGPGISSSAGVQHGRTARLTSSGADPPASCHYCHRECAGTAQVRHE
jgi:hypothetical protein